MEIADPVCVHRSTLALTGTTPEYYINGTVTPLNIPVTISDTVNGVVAETLVYLPLSIEPSLFSTVSLPNATAQLGQEFSYDLRPYLRNTTNIGNLAIAVSPSSNYTEWIKLDTDSYELMGVPPNQSSAITRRRHIHRKRVLYRRADARAIVQISATDLRTNLVSVANLNLDLAGLPTAAIPTPTSSSSPTGTTAAASSGKGGLSNGAKIALGVVLGLLGAAILAALLWFCCLRKREEKKQQKSLEKSRKSTESFAGMIKSPKADRNPFHNFALFGTNPVLPRSESAKLQNGEVPKFNSIYVQRPSAEGIQEPVRAVMDGDNEKPRQMDAMRGILRWDAQGKRISNGSHQSVPGLDYPSPVPGEIIRNDSLMPPGDASDFTHSFGSSSDSRASWESKETFQWSSAEGAHAPYRDDNGRPLSSAPSVPRPRNDFTPRYPRNALATGMGRPPSDTFSGHTFSEFHDHHGSQDHERDSLTHTHTGTGDTSFGTGSLSHTETHSGSGTIDGSSGSSQNGINYELATRAPAGFANGPSALGRIIGESGHFGPVAEEDEGYSDESAVLAVAERQSFDQQEAHRVARLMPSRERFTQSPTADLVSVASHTPSQEAIAENSDAFDDADEEGARERASTVYAPSDLTGLGYPAEAIVFGNRASQALSLGQRSESMRFVPPAESEIMSPPLPQVGNLVDAMSPPMDGAYRPMSTGSAIAGRYIACQNETFNLHPHINPPPQVSLSAATWSAPAPSTYRIESADGTPLPSWLHWDGKELELWGIPSLADAGQVLDVRVIERIPKPKRKSYDSSQLTPGEATEREVGACIIE
jgi:axial budding pattern protein 2